MRVRRELMRLAREIINRDRLADYDIARMCRTSRPRASTLIHGHIHLFNSETLIDILARLGLSLDVVVTRKRPYLRRIPSNPRPGWKPPPGFVGDDC